MAAALTLFGYLLVALALAAMLRFAAKSLKLSRRGDSLAQAFRFRLAGHHLLNAVLSAAFFLGLAWAFFAARDEFF